MVTRIIRPLNIVNRAVGREWLVFKVDIVLRRAYRIAEMQARRMNQSVTENPRQDAIVDSLSCTGIPQMEAGQTVNLLSMTRVVRLHPCAPYARLVKQVDAHDSGSCAARRKGSSPLSCTWSTVSASCDHLRREKLSRSAFLCPISLTDRACGYGPQYRRPTRLWGTVRQCRVAES